VVADLPAERSGVASEDTRPIAQCGADSLPELGTSGRARADRRVGRLQLRQVFAEDVCGVFRGLLRAAQSAPPGRLPVHNDVDGALASLEAYVEPASAFARLDSFLDLQLQAEPFEGPGVAARRLRQSAVCQGTCKPHIPRFQGIHESWIGSRDPHALPADPVQ